VLCLLLVPAANAWDGNGCRHGTGFWTLPITLWTRKALAATERRLCPWEAARLTLFRRRNLDGWSADILVRPEKPEVNGRTEWLTKVGARRGIELQLAVAIVREVI